MPTASVDASLQRIFDEARLRVDTLHPPSHRSGRRDRRREDSWYRVSVPQTAPRSGRRVVMTFTKITCAGAGTMGSQVAWQMAFHGKHVTVYDAIPEGLERARHFHRAVRGALRRRARRNPRADRRHIRSAQRTPPTYRRRSRDADLISESVPESIAIKESFWRDVSTHAPAHTVFTTNTSTLAPSALLRVSSIDRRTSSPCTSPSAYGTPTSAK